MRSSCSLVSDVGSRSATPAIGDCSSDSATHLAFLVVSKSCPDPTYAGL